MNKQKTLLIFCLTLLFNLVSGQTFKEQFGDLVSKRDTLEQRLLLLKWESVDNNDPELYVAYFNYYVHKSESEILAIGQNPKGKDALQIMDQDTTKKEPVAFIYGNTYYEPKMLSRGFDWITKGIKRHPNRLDMRFGKIYLFGQLEDYEKFTAEIINAIDYSTENKNQWTWADSKALEDPKEFMLSSIQSYQIQLYNTENDSLLNNMKRIAETVLKYYPDHIESLSNLSIVHILQKQYDKGLEYLLKAEKLNPEDYIVLGNIAQAYKLKEDKKSAIKYYELTAKYGGDDAKKFAQEQIDELNKK
jgi:tetratricopeptide (TPR) repeat protein